MIASRSNAEVTVESGAVFSSCRSYRYELWRAWDDLLAGKSGYVMFVGLNPSTADETVDDRTVRRCIGFARSWGYRALCIGNLFAWRATDPTDMVSATDPIGPKNDAHLMSCARGAALVVVAWGARGVHLGRDRQVRALLPAAHYLRLTKGGHPEHPLYLPANLVPVPWSAG